MHTAAGGVLRRSDFSEPQQWFDLKALYTSRIYVMNKWKVANACSISPFVDFEQREQSEWEDVFVSPLSTVDLFDGAYICLSQKGGYGPGL